MVLLFNASIDRNAVLPGGYTLSLILFAIGLAVAFGAAAASYLIGTRIAFWVGQSATALAGIEMNEEDLAAIEAEHGEQGPDTPLPMSIAEHEARLLECEAHLLKLVTYGQRNLFSYACSALLFAAGILSPIITDLMG